MTPIAPPPAATAHFRCTGCRYDLYGLPGNRCPECGTTNDLLSLFVQQRFLPPGGRIRRFRTWITSLVAPSSRSRPAA